MHSPYRVLAKAASLLVVLGGSLVATEVCAQTHWDTVTVGSLKADFADIEATYLTGERSAACEREALAAGKRWLGEGFHPNDANIAAEKVYRLGDLAMRLPSQRELLHLLADSAYNYRITDTSRANRGQFLLAIGCFELNRGEDYLCKAAVDSALYQGEGIIELGTRAACHKIRGYALSRLGKHAEAYADFTAAAHYSGQGGDIFGQVSALEAGARAAIVTGEPAEALVATEAAVALLAQMPGGGKDVAEAYNVFISRAKALAAVGQRDDALLAMHRGLDLASERQDNSRIIESKIGAAQVEFALGRFDESIAYASSALRATEALGLDHLEYDALVALCAAQKADGRFAAALASAEQILRLKDSIDARRLSYGLEDLRVRHRHQAIQQQFTILKAEQRALQASQQRIEMERWAFVLAGVAALAVIIAVFLRLRSRRRSQRQLQTLVDARTAEIAAQKADLVAQAERLRRSNTELERFAYIASHDLKTPVRNVSSFLGLIERRLEPEARAGVQEYLDLASGSARQMHALVTDVLEFSKLDVDIEARSCKVDLAGLLDKLSRQLAPQFEVRGGTLEIRGTASAWGPPNYLSQLFANLIENGLKYNRSACPRVQVSMAGAGTDWVEVSVEDNGIGIAEAYFDKVFEMFKRLHTTDEFQGTGLGLAVCKKVVERLGGGISLESVEGEGSTFTIRLPAKPTCAKQASCCGEVRVGVEG